MTAGAIRMIPLPGDEAAEAYVTRPDDGSYPGVLFIIDAIGLRPRIFDMADRIASWGYVVMAPNVLYRSGTAAETSPRGPLHEPGAREGFMRAAMSRVAALTTDKLLPDIDAYVSALTSLPGVSSPIGVTGYCMGTRIAMRAAGAHPELVAAVGGFHGGRLVTDAADSPHLSLPGARAEFLFGHADKDPSLTPEDADRLNESLDAAGLTYTAQILPGAPHGYTMSDTPVYSEAATEWHFHHLHDLFARTIAAR